MADLAAIYTALNSTTLKQRFSAACFLLATTIRTEPGGTANHVNRLDWAKTCFNDDAYLSKTGSNALRLTLVINPAALALGVAMTDTDIEGYVTTILGNANLLTMIG